MSTTKNCYRVMRAANQHTPGREESRHESHASALTAAIRLAKDGGCVWLEFVHAAGSLEAHDGEDYVHPRKEETLTDLAIPHDAV